MEPVLRLRIMGDLLWMLIGSETWIAWSVWSWERSSRLPWLGFLSSFWFVRAKEVKVLWLNALTWSRKITKEITSWLLMSFKNKNMKSCSLKSLTKTRINSILHVLPSFGLKTNRTNILSVWTTVYMTNLLKQKWCIFVQNNQPLKKKGSWLWMRQCNAANLGVHVSRDNEGTASSVSTSQLTSFGALRSFYLFQIRQRTANFLKKQNRVRQAALITMKTQR